jgi:hypothetical protein
MSANEIANSLQASFMVLTQTTTAAMRAAGTGYVAGSLNREGAGVYTVDLELPLVPLNPAWDPVPGGMIVASHNGNIAIATFVDVSQEVGATPGVWDRLRISVRNSLGILDDLAPIVNITIVKFPTEG